METAFFGPLANLTPEPAVSALELVIDLPFLASEINAAHREITVHARGMLLEAKRAGDALLAAKAKVKHGEFQTWVESHCRCSYRTSAKYMQVSRLAAKAADLGTFDGVDAFLEAHAKPRITPTTRRPSFTVDDAERLLNMQARVERGEGAEKVVAAAKVAAVAKEHGISSEQIVSQARALCPNREKSADLVEREAALAEAELRMAETDARIEALQASIDAFQRREAIILRLMDIHDDARLELLADALLRLEDVGHPLRID